MTSKGSSINDVTPKFQFFDPLPPLVTPCHLCLNYPLEVTSPHPWVFIRGDVTSG